MNREIRAPAVAGMFYPADPNELRREVEGYLSEAPSSDGTAPKALIVPHAGYIYSGPVAASAYARIQSGEIRRVVLLGPSHRVMLCGAGASGAAAWHTPLGDVPVEVPGDLPVNDTAHREEHSLEVQLPFLQVILDDFQLTPLVIGQAGKEEIADILESLWGAEETLIVISSDLSHYHDYETARRMDTAASSAIVNLDPEGLDEDSACGRIPIRGLLHLARLKGMRVELLDQRSSGDTAGPRDQVVGYGAYALYE